MEEVICSDQLSIAVLKLSNRERKSLNLHLVCKMKYAEIAAILGLRTNTVERCYARTIKKLRRYMEEEGEGERLKAVCRKKPNWFATGLKVKGNRTKANKMLLAAWRIATKGILPEKHTAKVQAPLPSLKQLKRSADMLYSAYILLCLQASRSSWEEVTYSAYYRQVVSVIAPYFEEQGIKLNELTTVDIQNIYSYVSRRSSVSGNTLLHYHANIRKSLIDAVRIYRLIIAIVKNIGNKSIAENHICEFSAMQ